MLTMMKNRNRNRKNRNELFVTFKGIKYGAFAGFIATWSISSLIAAIELLLDYLGWSCNPPVLVCMYVYAVKKVGVRY